jgi:hypothetical protein
MKAFVIILVIALVVLAAYFMFWRNEAEDGILNGEEDQVFCTADAKLCPDGSYVGRVPTNNCEFAPCPSSSTSTPGSVLDASTNAKL